MDDNMKCDKCGKSVPETSTGSCAIAHIEVSDYISIDNKRRNKLCAFDDMFFCEECLDGNICHKCSKILTNEEKSILKNLNKI